VSTRLLVGWALGAAVSVVGLVASAALDLPTGATVACVFGVGLVVWWTATRLLARRATRDGSPD
jgi:ABC-type Mn2+/Zn2+ transport system permease subunit